MSEDTIIAQVRKNSKETIRVTLGSFEGYQLCGLRVWFTPAPDQEERPGKSGIAIRVSILRDLIAALKEAEAEAVRRGLIESGGGR